MSTAEPDREFLTIVTFGRSGSTALQAALNAHPHTIIRGENYNALRGLHAYVDAVAAAADRHNSGKPHHPWFGTARLDAPAVLADQRRHVIAHLLRPKADTRWLGFKEVRYEIGHFVDADVMTDYLLFINALLPGVRYVINVRDPQAAARSGWWREHPDAVTALGRSVEHLREAAGTLADVLGPGRVALTEYEQWSADPSIGVSALKSIGFPVQEALIRESLSTHLEHGQNSERP
ncbi:MAG: hypothetical protein GKR84_04790 [Candidatus Nanopelagicales bacterium]|nr:hypothetical protein [Candidatus Nanopelagicales bacterium]